MSALRLLAAKIMAILILVLGVTAVKPCSAQTGIVVVDRLTETNATQQTAKQVLQYVKQGQQYVTQLQQYQNMLVNTLAPAAYIWDTAQQTMSQIQQYNNLLQYYTNFSGGLPGYLQRFEDVSAYSSSACFNLNSCSAPTLYNNRSDMLSLQQSTAQGQTRVLSSQQQGLQTDAQTIQRIQTLSATSTGRLQVEQAGNELASHNAYELLQMRALMVSEQAAASAKQEADTQDDVLSTATRKRLTTFDYTPPASMSLQ